jgi:hypothetical protein
VIILNPPDVLQVVAGGTQPIQCNASWVDQVPGTPITFVPDQKSTIIGTPGTTVVVITPPVGRSRNVKEFSAFNAGTLAEQVTVQTFDGVTAITKYSVLLQPGYTIHNDDLRGWYTIDDQGKILVTAAVIMGAGINLSAGTTSNAATAFTFFDSNNISFGLNASTLTASYAFKLSAGTTSNNLSAITFANSNGVSFGLNNGTVTASGGVGTITAFSQDADFVTVFTANQALLSFQKLSLPMNLAATQMAIIADFAGVSSVSGAVTISHAVYTLSGGTASLASSGSRVISWASGSATNNSTQFGGVSGSRYRTVGVDYSMTPGDYLFGWWISTENSATANVFGRAAMNIVGTFDGIETNYFLNGISASTTVAFPGSIAATDTNYVRTGFSALRQPGAILIGTH